MLLLNPKTFKGEHLDPKSKALMLKTIQFFETRGKTRLKQDDHDRAWYSDFLEFIKKEQIFATLMTPSGYGKSDSRWDTWRICQFNEILGFYGLNYWYTWQVTMLGLGPIWMSKNEEVKNRTAQLLQEGGIFAFGLSEKEHGADLYSSEMKISSTGEGKYKANGSKYYIGNANKAALVSTFGKIAPKNDYVFFAVDPKNQGYKCIKNVVNSQNYVAEYSLTDYELTEKDILSKGQGGWDSALNTINICKYNLGWASIGICTHSFYEAIHHAANRKLFDHSVTDFSHIRQFFVDAYARLTAMKLFALRAADYMRSASKTDQRYLLFNPIVKMKVTTQGEEVINLLWDIIAAKGFEKDMYFETAARDIRALPKLEGTVHVNMALIVKFMKNYFFNPGVFPEIKKRDDQANDDFLFNQGPTRGLGKIQFHDYRITYSTLSSPNLEIFKKQIKKFKVLLALAKPSSEQTQDFNFLHILGELFTLVVYGQLIIENAIIYKLDANLVDQIFDFMVRDFSKFALLLHTKTNSTRVQAFLSKNMIYRPVNRPERFEEVWTNHVFVTRDAYRMKD